MDNQYPTTQIEGRYKGFFLGFDSVRKDLGLIASCVYGQIHRYCDMPYGVCFASHQKIADDLSISRSTVIRHIQKLIENKYLKDTTPDRKNKPHVYKTTGKVSVRTVTEEVISELPGVSESNSGVSESNSGCVRKTLEETNKKQTTNKKNVAVVVALSEFGLIDPALTELATAWDLETATAWVSYCKDWDMGPGYLIKRFRAGDPLPPLANTTRNGERIQPGSLGRSVEAGSGELPQTKPKPWSTVVWDNALRRVILPTVTLESQRQKFIYPLTPLDNDTANGVLKLEAPSDVIEWVNNYYRRCGGSLSEQVTEANGKEIEVLLVEKAGDSI